MRFAMRHVYESASSEDRKHHRARLMEHLEKLDTWALHCPENFANRAALVGAEVARIEGRDARCHAPVRAGH